MKDCNQCNRAIDSALEHSLYQLGKCVGERPGYFIIVPLLLTALCASGFQRMNYNYDPEYLFSPTSGQAKGERAILEAHFPMNYSDFKASRMSRVGKFGRIAVVPKDGGSILRSHLWTQLLYLDEMIHNISVTYNDVTYVYNDICAKWNGNCYENEILRLAHVMPSIEKGDINMTYPIYFDPFTYETYILPAFFGGVTLNDMSTIDNVKAVAISYFLDMSESWHVDLGYQWEEKFLKVVDKEGPIHAPDLLIGMFVSNTPAWEMENSKNTMTPTLLANIVCMIIFSILGTAMSDAAKSKSLIGFAGLVSSTLASLGSFGFCCYIGIEFISLNFAAPFLLLGIGLDDTFVMLSAWQRSSIHSSIPERLGKCYSDAAVSITVTSLTNFLSFIAGVITPFPCVRIFCIYTGISIAFIYVWQLTLFGALLSLAGHAEKKNYHGLFCVKVTPKSLSLHRSWIYRVTMTGGLDPKDPSHPLDNQDHAGMVFFRDSFGKLLSMNWFKSLVLLLFGVYIVLASWGLTQVKEGLDKKNTANYDSYSVTYYEMDDEYFKEYAYSINVIVTSRLPYSDLKTQEGIESIMTALENSSYVDKSLSQSWLREFLSFVQRNKGYSDVELPVSNERDFIQTLQRVYLSDSSSPLRLDVEFNEDKTQILASRFFIQGHNIYDSYTEQKMVEDLRERCNIHSTEDISVTIFQPYFIYIDQYLAITPQTIQCVLVTALIIIIVSFILIPSFICSLWVAFSIVSIELGVIGYMAWWNVSLDGVALINLIMCIGFSVDYSAHIVYHYITSKATSPDERISSSLYALGIPIIQAAVSTIIGVFGLVFAPSYLFVTFFKMVFLVIVLGALHGLVLLPVLLSLFGPGSCRSVKIPSDSGHSTPMSSVHRRPTVYTLNLGYVSDSSNSSPLHSFSPLSSSSCSLSSKSHLRHGKSLLKNEESQQRFAYLSRKSSHPNRIENSITIHGRNGGGLSLPPDYPYLVSHQRIPSQRHEIAIISHLRRSAMNSKSAPNMPINNRHQRLSRSKSHHPQTESTAVAMESIEQHHAALRKYHSYPYEMFNNETGYSSDDS